MITNYTDNNTDSAIDAALSEVMPGRDDLINCRKNRLFSCLAFGKELSGLEQEIPSTKLRGTEVAKRFPLGHRMHSADRSGCKWLYEALHKPGHPANDILRMLRIRTIEDICMHSGHPAVIRRMYREAKKAKPGGTMTITAYIRNPGSPEGFYVV